MKLGNPFCSGEPGRRHPLGPCRLELAPGVCPRWRCPECWHATDFIEEPPLDAFLSRYGMVAALISQPIADQLRVASRPAVLQIEPTNDPRVVDIFVRTVEFEEP